LRSVFGVLVFIGVCLMMNECRSESSGEMKFSFNPNKTSQPFVMRVSEVPSTIKAAASFSEIITIDRVLRLAPSTRFAIGQVSDLSITSDKIFIYDRSQSVISIHSLETGEFIGFLGRHGQGPGEYADPSGIEAWRDYLVVYNRSNGRYIFYDSEGGFVNEIRAAEMGVVSGSYLIWEDRFIALNTVSYNHNEPHNLICDFSSLDLSQPDPTPKPLYGFGKRLASFYKEEPIIWSLEQSIVVGSRVWVCAPYESTIRVFDLDGCPVGDLKAGFPDGLSDELKEYDNVKNVRDGMDIQRRHTILMALKTVGDYVVACYSSNGKPCFNIFDTEGNLLGKIRRDTIYDLSKTCVLASRPTKSLSTHMVAPLIPEIFLKPNLKEYVSDEQLKLFLDAGLNLEKIEEDEAVYLTFLSPKV